ncbi:MAG: hypothetical protein IPM85_09640 [Chitinophagaceae bacterium]|nr:hypothetical protein [Chitinophagaceae bacterium]
MLPPNLIGITLSSTDYPTGGQSGFANQSYIKRIRNDKLETLAGTYYLATGMAMCGNKYVTMQSCFGLILITRWNFLTATGSLLYREKIAGN